jgi:hypothetical protein
LLSETALTEAIDLQRRTYGLLRWVDQAIEREFVNFDAAHHYLSAAQAAAAWIRSHYDNIPPRFRPEAREGESLIHFANVFASYLLTSFDIVAEPGQRLVSPCGCFCPLCAHLVAASHLRPKKLDGADKHRARTAMKRQLMLLAREAGARIDEESVGSMLDEPEHQRQTALVAWAHELLARMRGEETDASVLALWRQFAWTPQGSPRKDFEPRVEDILAAERALMDALASRSSTQR